MKNWIEEKSIETKEMRVNLKPSSTERVLWMKQTQQVEQTVTPTIKILMLTYHIGVKQEVVKNKRLECASWGENLMLRL